MNSIWFSPKNDFEEILASKKSERKEKLEKLKQRIKEQYIEIATILAFVENETLENSNITYEELMNKIKFSEKISNENIKLIIDWIKSFFKDRKIAQDRYEKYKNNYDLMFEELFDKKDTKLKWKVDLQVYGWCLVISFSKIKDFIEIAWWTFTSWWYYNNEKNIIVINDWLKISSYKNTLFHEYQHYINKLIFWKEILEQLSNQKQKMDEFERFTRNEIGYYELLYNILIFSDMLSKAAAYSGIKNEILARLKWKSSDFEIVTEVLTEDSTYLSDLENINLQSVYWIKFLSYVKKLKKIYPRIYIYLAALIEKDRDFKLFLKNEPKFTKKILETQLVLSNFLLDDKVKKTVFIFMILWNLYILYLGLNK